MGEKTLFWLPTLLDAYRKEVRRLVSKLCCYIKNITPTKLNFIVLWDHTIKNKACFILRGFHGGYNTKAKRQQKRNF